MYNDFSTVMPLNYNHLIDQFFYYFISNLHSGNDCEIFFVKPTHRWSYGIVLYEIFTIGKSSYVK